VTASDSVGSAIQQFVVACAFGAVRPLSKVQDPSSVLLPASQAFTAHFKVISKPRVEKGSYNLPRLYTVVSNGKERATVTGLSLKSIMFLNEFRPLPFGATSVLHILAPYSPICAGVSCGLKM
jgi:hypothetical protein